MNYLSFIKCYIIDALKPFYPNVELGKNAKENYIRVACETKNIKKKNNNVRLNICVDRKRFKRR